LQDVTGKNKRLLWPPVLNPQPRPDEVSANNTSYEDIHTRLLIVMIFNTISVREIREALHEHGRASLTISLRPILGFVFSQYNRESQKQHLLAIYFQENYFAKAS
jgi:hypothetical protein